MGFKGGMFLLLSSLFFTFSLSWPEHHQMKVKTSVHFNFDGLVLPIPAENTVTGTGAATDAVAPSSFPLASTPWPYQQYVGSMNYEDRGASTFERPGILIFPDIFNMEETFVAEAVEWAKAGAFVLVADIYGGGIRYDRGTENGIGNAFVKGTSLKTDSETLRNIAMSAYNTLVNNTDDRIFPAKSKIACIGRGIGGQFCLELSRSGAELAASVSIGGSLRTSQDAKVKESKAVYAFTGALDTDFTSADVDAFTTQLVDADIDFYHQTFGKAKGCWYDSSAGLLVQNSELFPSTKCEYNVLATTIANRESKAEVKRLLGL